MARKFLIELITSVLAFFFLADSSHAKDLSVTPVDPARLKLIQSKLESYLTRISSCQITYMRELISHTKNASEPTVTLHELLTNGTSYKKTTTIAPNAAHSRSSEVYYHEGRKVGLFRDMHQATVDSANHLSIGVVLPLRVIGLPLLTTQDLKLSEFLKYPQITEQFSDEVLLNQQVIVLKVGPGVGAAMNYDHPCWNDGWMKLWLAKDLHFMPLRTEIFFSVTDQKHESLYAKSTVPMVEGLKADGSRGLFYRLMARILELQEVTDIARRTQISVPRVCEMVSGITERDTCTQFSVNPIIPLSSFCIEIPSSYNVTENGVSRIPQIANKSTRQLETAIGDKAKRLLSHPIPNSVPPSARERWVWYVTPCVAVLTFCFWLFERKRG